jgi:hypothetical protein
MNRLLPLLLCLAWVSLRADDGALKRYLYLSTPDASQKGGSGTGILVFDIDDGHRFVRRIDAPFPKEGLRGFCVSLVRHAAYYTTTSGRLGAFDLEAEKVIWQQQFERGCDRACITPDGRKLYVPTGWWWKELEGGFLVVNPDNGELIKRIVVGPQAHNSIATLDGKFVLLGTQARLTVFRAEDDSIVHNVAGVGEAEVSPFTVDSRNRFAYVCLYKHIGFDIVDLQTGKATHRVMAGPEPITRRTHGIGFTPDEKELWISDQAGKQLVTFDATQMPPKETGRIGLSQAGHGWVTFSLDGRYAWCHTPDVIDAHTRKIVATLKDETGAPVCGSKFFEIHFRNGKVVAVGNEFGLGRAHPPAR